MLTANDIIIRGLAGSQALLNRYTADLTPAEFLHRPAAAANCTAWLIGHLAMSDRRVLTQMGAADLPPLPDGFEKRFSRDEGCPQAADFGDVTGLMAIFNRHRELLIERVKAASNEALDKPLEKPHPMFGKVGEMVAFMSLHTAMHAGQITIVRRSLGRPPLM